MFQHRAFKKTEHPYGYKTAQKRQDKPRKSGFRQFYDAVIRFNVLGDTGRQLVIFVGFVLDDVDDIVDGNSSDQAPQLIDYRNGF
ncbi:hypothetical protein D9M71_779720 [compost metagenome]